MLGSVTNKSGLAVQDYMLSLAEVSSTSIVYKQCEVYKKIPRKGGSCGSPGPWVHCLYRPGFCRMCEVIR